jgi:NADH-quinone oxidoreductase subunit L
MAIPLIVLAVGSALAGFVGVPHVLHGENRIEKFLEPVFEVHASPVAGEPVAASAEAQAEASHSDDLTRVEGTLMGLSVLVAITGIGIAWFFWNKRPDIPANLATQFGGLYRVLLNKYYLDEIYDALFVQPIKRISEGALWKGVDAGLIDGSVNGVGATVQASSQVLRRLQTGSVRTYAASLFLGAVMILGWYLWT